jgi:2-dehydropantoate 2-reductase
MVTAMNGIPWWYFYKKGGMFEGRKLESVDPWGMQWDLIGPERAIGCVVDPACEIIAPSVIEHNEFNRFILGEPDGTRSERVVKLAEALTAANFDAPIRDAIRWNVWLKLWGNVCFNPISALCKQTMLEAKAVTEALNVHIGEDMIERRLNVAGQAVGHKMSMLQDLERKRSMEIDALVTAVQELGRLTGVPTPTVDILLTLVREEAWQAGLY